MGGQKERLVRESIGHHLVGGAGIVSPVSVVLRFPKRYQSFRELRISVDKRSCNFPLLSNEADVGRSFPPFCFLSPPVLITAPSAPIFCCRSFIFTSCPYFLFNLYIRIHKLW